MKGTVLKLWIMGFTLVTKAHYGFLGLFGGSSEKLRRFLGYVDYFFDLLLPERMKYIGTFIFYSNEKRRGCEN